MDATSTPRVETPVTLERLLLLAAAAMAGAAGVIHLDAAGKHFEHTLIAVAFIAMGVAQLALAGALLQRASRLVLVALVLTSWSIVCIWVVTRVTAMPSVPGLQAAEPAGVPDVIATALELATVAAVVALLVLPATRLRALLHSGGRTLTATATAALVLMAVAVVAPHHHDHGHTHGLLTASSAELADEASHADGHYHASVGRAAKASSTHQHADGETHDAITFEEAAAVLLGHDHAAASGTHAHAVSAAVSEGAHDHAASHDHPASHDHEATTAAGHSHSAPRQEQVILQGSGSMFEGSRISYEPATPDGKHGAAVRGHNPQQERNHAEMHAVNKSCSPSTTQRKVADHLLRDSRKAIAKYDNSPGRALADGFIAYPIPLSKMFHMVSPARTSDKYELVPSKVESFMYAMTDSGLKAIGVMYMFEPRAAVPPNPTGCILQWHRHTGTQGAVTSFDPQHPYASAWMAHIWTFGYDDPWHDGDGTEPHTWFFAYRNIPNVCDGTGQCV